MHEISQRSMEAIQRAHAAVADAQARLHFILLTVQDAYNLPGAIIEVAPEQCAVRCAPADTQTEE
jgi:hypothetical protein